MSSGLDGDILRLDCEAEIERIALRLRTIVSGELKRRGLVVALSGGVDSSVCAALCVRAVGAGKVYALLLPEHESSSASRDLGAEVAKQLGIRYSTEEIGPALEALGCYERRNAAMRRVVPALTSEWKTKIVIARVPGSRLSFFKLVAQAPDGSSVEKRLPAAEYLEIVAATSLKQRLRKTLEYFHADRLNYAVVGTPNRLEYDQGFFVKNGDGSADVKPIAHLYKTQVYAIARHLGLPDAVCAARPTTDTYTLAQSQDEFYFTLPYEQMDVALWAHNHGVAAAELALHLGVTPEVATSVYADIESKRRTTAYLHAGAVLIDAVTEIHSTSDDTEFR